MKARACTRCPDGTSTGRLGLCLSCLQGLTRLRGPSMEPATIPTVQPAARTGDVRTSMAGAVDVKLRAGSQRAQLLAAYLHAPGGLTADEAMRQAGVPERSCYWKRVSELTADGLLEDLGRERTGEQGSQQRVCGITDAGRAALRTAGVLG